MSWFLMAPWSHDEKWPEGKLPLTGGDQDRPHQKEMIYGMDILASVQAIKDPGSLIELLFLPISLSPDNNMQLDEKCYKYHWHWLF